MHHFFVEAAQIGTERIWLAGNDVNHIKNVLRMGVGDTLTIGNGQDDRLYRCRITDVGNDRIWAAIESVGERGSELSSKIFLFQGLPKSDKMAWIIQKAVELGVYEVIPVITRRTVVKLDERKKEARNKRWNAISEGAAKQSGRMRVPQVSGQMTFQQALEYASRAEVKLIPYEQAEGMPRTREILGNIKSGQSIAVFIGPEGGFEEEEIASAAKAGFEPITLGGRILRTETAGMATLAMLGFLLDGR